MSILKTISKKFNLMIIKLDNLKIIKLNDALYLKMLYKVRMNKKLNLKNPISFNEKLQWLKLNDHNNMYTKMVDKYEVKKYIVETIGQKYVIPTIGIYNKFDEINFEKLPNEFVIKCTHDSGGVVICSNKEQLNIKDVRNKINKNLKTDFFRLGREWPYKNVKPRIIIEKYMKDNKNNDILDYKLMCFNGKVKCSFVCSERRSSLGLAVDFYDLSWNKMPFKRHYRNSNVFHEKPKNYDLMIKLAEKLSKGIPFVRVDFYEINGEVYFGEMTFYPGCGFEEFMPDEWDIKLGDWITLPKKRGDLNETVNNRRYSANRKKHETI